MPNTYNFCPCCATALQLSDLSGRERHSCPACNWVHWNNPLPVVAAVIELEGQVLLARNAAWPAKMFGLVTGFMERDETPEQAVAREVKEETGLDTDACKLIGVYEFMRKNELIIAYHVQAAGSVTLNEELAEYRLVAPEKLKPWRTGTGFALADWLNAKGIVYEWLAFP
jgi:NAD+ diphosphatase